MYQAPISRSTSGNRGGALSDTDERTRIPTPSTLIKTRATRRSSKHKLHPSVCLEVKAVRLWLRALGVRLQIRRVVRRDSALKRFQTDRASSAAEVDPFIRPRYSSGKVTCFSSRMRECGTGPRQPAHAVISGGKEPGRPQFAQTKRFQIAGNQAGERGLISPSRI